MQNIMHCNKEAIDTYMYLSKNIERSNHVFLSEPKTIFATNFMIVTKKGTKMSIAHPIDTYGELESILYDASGVLDHDSLVYHFDREALMQYILQN